MILNGVIPKGYIVAHIDGNNRINNLKKYNGNYIFKNQPY